MNQNVVLTAEKVAGLLSWGLCPQTPGVYRLDAIPCPVWQNKGPRGAHRAPRHGLAPETALGLLSSSALSSAQAACYCSESKKEVETKNQQPGVGQ